MISVPRFLRRRRHKCNRSTSTQGFQKFGRRFLDYFPAIVIHFFETDPRKSRVFSYNRYFSSALGNASDKFCWLFKKNHCTRANEIAL